MRLAPYSAELARMLLELEDELNRDRFFGIPLGSSLASWLIVEFWNGQGVWPFGRRWQCRVQRAARSIRFPDRSSSAPAERAGNLPEHPLLVTWQRDDPRHNGLIEPLLAHLAPAETVILPGETSLLKRTAGFATLPLDAPRLPDPGRWRREYRRVAPKWDAILRRHVGDGRLPKPSLPLLKLVLLLQSQKVPGYLSLLEKLQPRAILTEFDRGRHSSCLVLAARQLGIATATLVHGTINPPYGYNPVLADRICAWGELQREQLLSLGVAPERIRLTGFARMRPPEQRDPLAIRASVGLPPDKPVILLATNPIEKSARDRMIRLFCDTFAGRDELSPVVRTHPAESEHAWDAYRDRYPGIQVFGRGRQSVEDALAMTDVFVCNNTGMAADALLYGLPLVLLDVPGSDLLSNRGLVDEGLAVCVNNGEDLSRAVNSLLADSGESEAMKTRRERYRKRLYHLMGDDAARAAVEELHRLAAEGRRGEGTG